MTEPTVETRPRLESIDELSPSALVLLDEPSLIEVVEPSLIEVSVEPLLARYEDCPADPTVRMLPDFSVVDDSPTVPRALRAPLDDETARLPAPPKPSEPPIGMSFAPSQLPEPASVRVPAPPLLGAPDAIRLPAPPKLPELVTLLPSPRSSLPPPPVLPNRPSSRPRVKGKKARSLPPVAPLPQKRTESLPAPALPKEFPRPTPTLEWALAEALPAYDAEDTERTSVIPVSSAVSREPKARRKIASLLPALVGALLGLALFVGIYFALQPSRPAVATGRKDALLITVAGPGGGAIEAPQVFIDGVRRCEISPCLVPGLPEGLHFVTVTAPSFVTTSPRVVRVTDREAALLHVELAKDAAPPAPTTQPVSAPEPPASMSQLPLDEAPVPAPTFARPSQPTPNRPTAPVALGSAFLNLNSIPASAVLLDGQPLGRTPKLNVAVKPGPHVVVFAHPEQGRRARTVSVEVGERQTVAVKF